MMAPYRSAAMVYSIGVLAAWTSCATSSTAPTNTDPAAALHVAISDPVGDAVADSRIAVSPDLASATVDVVAGTITFLVQFAPGTVDRSTTWVRVELDTDQNSATGNRERNGMGSDYTLLLLANGTRASVQKYWYTAGGTCASCVGDVPMSFVGDTLQVSVPVSIVGKNSDGHLFFLVKTWAVVGTASLVGFDSMPNDNLPPGRT